MVIKKIAPGLGKDSSMEDLNRSLEVLLSKCDIQYTGELHARVYYDYVHIYPVGVDSKITEVRNRPEFQVRLRTSTPSSVTIGRFNEIDPHNYVIHFEPIDEGNPELFRPI